MDREFFERKIKELSDDKLQELLKLRSDANREIIDLAIEEAKNRGLAFPDVAVVPDGIVSAVHDDEKRLEKWNWGAFLLAPFWTLANRLEKWTILTFIPVVNVGAAIYLGLYGNRLAFGKSEIRDINQFMILQGHWSKWAIRIFWLSIAASTIWLFI